MSSNKAACQLFRIDPEFRPLGLSPTEAFPVDSQQEGCPAGQGSGGAGTRQSTLGKYVGLCGPQETSVLHILFVLFAYAPAL